MRLWMLAPLVLALASCLGPSAQVQQENSHVWPEYDHCTGSWHRGDHVGTVGLPYTSELRGKCPAGRWSFDRVTVATGHLPPGLRIAQDGSITGVPEEDGVWHCTVLISGINCPCGTMKKYFPDGFTATEGFCFTR